MSNENTVAITSLSFDEIVKDVNYDRIFIFILAYEYSMNFNQLLTLYRFSSDIFWTYINTLRPILKLGDRKAGMIKQSARKVFFKLLGSQVELNAKENEYLSFLSQYIKDSFTNKEECLHCFTIKAFPLIAKGNYIDRATGRQYDEVEIHSTEELFKYIDKTNYILIDGERYDKTSRVEYMLEKYYGALNSIEIRRKNVKEIISMMDAEAILNFANTLEERANAISKQREALINRGR